MDVCYSPTIVLFGSLMRFVVPTEGIPFIYYGAHDGDQIVTIRIDCQYPGEDQSKEATGWVSRLRPSEIAGTRTSIPGATCRAYAYPEVNFHLQVCDYP